MPRVDDVISRIAGAKFFSSLDLASGFHQIPIAPDHRDKTAFTKPDGLYEFHRLPFGLCGAAPTFQRLMDRVLDKLKWKECLVYIDDLLIMCSSFEEHLNQLDRVLSALESAGLTLNVDKCLFAARETIYLGFKISEGRILPDPEKVRAVAEFPRPTTVTQIRSFVRMASLYRRFIKDFASIAQPLHRLLKKGENVRNQVK